jgi:hypothetical protein
LYIVIKNSKAAAQARSTIASGIPCKAKPRSKFLVIGVIKSRRSTWISLNHKTRGSVHEALGFNPRNDFNVISSLIGNGTIVFIAQS